MATAKRPTRAKPKSKSAGTTKKKVAAKAPTRAASPKQPAAPISAVTGLPIREKVHLPIKGYGRFNAFQVVENLFGKTTAQLKQILEYEQKHQARRMIIDRINDMLRRAGVK